MKSWSREFSNWNHRIALSRAADAPTERLHNSEYKSRDFDALRDLTITSPSTSPSLWPSWVWPRFHWPSHNDVNLCEQNQSDNIGMIRWWWFQIACPATTRIQPLGRRGPTTSLIQSLRGQSTCVSAPTTCTQPWGGRSTYHHMNSIIGRSICRVWGWPQQSTTLKHLCRWNVCSLDQRYQAIQMLPN